MYSLFKFFLICKTTNLPARFNSEVINKSGTLDKNILAGMTIDKKQFTNPPEPDGQVISNYQFIKFQFVSSCCLFCDLQFGVYLYFDD